MGKKESETGRNRPLRASRQSGVSLERAIAKMGLASRTEALGWIEGGRVSVNGRPCVNPKKRVLMGRDRIEVEGVTARPAQKIYLALNKPRGLVTTARDERGRPTVFECLKNYRDLHLAPVGRLDMASEGLLFFTNDTAWAAKLLNPESHVAKTYDVQIDRHLGQEALGRLCSGVTLEDGQRTRPAKVRALRAGPKTCWLEIEIDEGLNRQIRRMMKAVGARVMRLVRVAVGPVVLGGLPKGGTRPLQPEELRAIRSYTSTKKGYKV